MAQKKSKKDKGNKKHQQVDLEQISGGGVEIFNRSTTVQDISRNIEFGDELNQTSHSNESPPIGYDSNDTSELNSTYSELDNSQINFQADSVDELVDIASQKFKKNIGWEIPLAQAVIKHSQEVNANQISYKDLADNFKVSVKRLGVELQGNDWGQYSSQNERRSSKNDNDLTIESLDDHFLDETIDESENQQLSSPETVDEPLNSTRNSQATDNAQRRDAIINAADITRSISSVSEKASNLDKGGEIANACFSALGILAKAPGAVSVLHSVGIAHELKKMCDLKKESMEINTLIEEIKKIAINSPRETSELDILQILLNKQQSLNEQINASKSVLLSRISAISGGVAGLAAPSAAPAIVTAMTGLTTVLAITEQRHLHRAASFDKESKDLIGVKRSRSFLSRLLGRK